MKYKITESFHIEPKEDNFSNNHILKIYYNMVYIAARLSGGMAREFGVSDAVGVCKKTPPFRGGAEECRGRRKEEVSC